MKTLKSRCVWFKLLRYITACHARQPTIGYSLLSAQTGFARLVSHNPACAFGCLPCSAQGFVSQLSIAYQSSCKTHVSTPDNNTSLYTVIMLQVVGAFVKLSHWLPLLLDAVSATQAALTTRINSLVVLSAMLHASGLVFLQHISPLRCLPLRPELQTKSCSVSLLVGTPLLV